MCSDDDDDDSADDAAAAADDHNGDRKMFFWCKVKKIKNKNHGIERWECKFRIRKFVIY